MSESFNLPEIPLSEDVLPRVPLEDVLALQALAMGRARRFARTRVARRDPNTNGFVLLHSTATTPEEGLLQMPNEYGEYEQDIQVDTYMAVLVRKHRARAVGGEGTTPRAQSWQFTLSFLRNELTDGARFTNERLRFTFSWERNDTEALGVRRRRVVDAFSSRVHETVHGDILDITHSVDTIRTEIIEPILPNELHMLHSAVDRHVVHYVNDSARLRANRRAA